MHIVEAPIQRHDDNVWVFCTCPSLPQEGTINLIIYAKTNFELKCK